MLSPLNKSVKEALSPLSYYLPHYIEMGKVESMFEFLLSDHQYFSNLKFNLIRHMARQIPFQIIRQNAKLLILRLNKF